MTQHEDYPDIRRRRLVQAALLAPLLSALPSLSVIAAGQQPTPAPARQPVASQRIIALEWLPVELLFALGVTPMGVASTEDYRHWVQQPVLPAGVIDVGQRTQPNLEFLTELQPDLILHSNGYGPRAQQLAAIAPLMGFDYTDKRGKPLDMARHSILALGQRLDRLETAHHHLADFDRQIAAAGDLLASYRRQPLLVFSLIDSRHALIVGGTNLFQQVLDPLGIRNAWQGESNFWGTAVVGIERLLSVPPCRALYLDQGNPGLLARAARSPLWQAIPFVRQHTWQQTPAIWFYGATLSALRFCQTLEQLEGEWHEPPKAG